MACAEPSWLKLSVRIAPRVVPMQGVHPAAKKIPINADETRLYRRFGSHCGRLSILSQGIFSTPSVINPKPTTTIPPTWLIIFLYSLKTWPKMVTVPPQPSIKTIENPITKATAWKNVPNFLRILIRGDVGVVVIGMFVGLYSCVNAQPLSRHSPNNHTTGKIPNIGS